MLPAIVGLLGAYQLLLPQPVTSFLGSPLLTALTGRRMGTHPDADAVLMGLVPLLVGAALAWTAWDRRAGVVAGVWRAVAGVLGSLLCLVWTAFLVPGMWPISTLLLGGAAASVLGSRSERLARFDPGGIAAVLLVVVAPGMGHFFVPLSNLMRGGQHLLPLLLGLVAAAVVWGALRARPFPWHGPPTFARLFLAACTLAIVTPVIGDFEVADEAYNCEPPAASECPPEGPGLRWLERGGDEIYYGMHLDPPRDTVVALARARFCEGEGTAKAVFFDLDGAAPRTSVDLPGCDRAYYVGRPSPDRMLPVCASGLQSIDLRTRTATAPPISWEDDLEKEAAILRPDGRWWLSGNDQPIIAEFDGETLQETGRLWMADGLHLATRLAALDFIEPGLFLHTSSTTVQVLGGDFSLRARRGTFGVNTWVNVDEARRLAYVPDTARRRLRVWTLPDLEPYADVPIDQGAYVAFHSSELGLTGIAHFHGRTVALYDADTLERRGVLDVGPGPRGADFDVAGRRLVGASRCGVYVADLDPFLTPPP